jgi:hypothetical protein
MGATMISVRRALGLTIVALAPTQTYGQSSEVVLEVGGSQFRPPVGVEGSPASFLVGGIRASRFLASRSQLRASVLAGRSLDAAASGNFATGEVGADLWQDLPASWAVGSEMRAFAFDVGGPFPYRAGGLEASAGVRFHTPAVSAELMAAGGWGRSTVELQRYTDGPTELVTDDLWRYGGSAQLLVGGKSVAAGLASALHESAGGRYRSLGGLLVVAAGGGGVELRLDVWDTPLGTETTGGLAVILPLGGPWSLRGFAGRSEPDPLTLAEPGRGGGGVLVGRRVAGMTYTAGRSLHEVLDDAPQGARVRFAVSVRGARVELLGDFTLWEPVAMTQQGSRWVAVLTVPEGTHHFGFLVDGSWYVPPDTQDAVPDEWGRQTATLVVESHHTPSAEGPGRQGAGR